MVTKCFRKALLISVACLVGSHSALAMEISPEVKGKIGVAGLALATNFVGYFLHELIDIEQDPSDTHDAVKWGLRATWLTANLHLLRSLVSQHSTSDVLKRGAMLSSASLVNNTLCKYLHNKLYSSITRERTVENAFKKGALLAVYTAGALVDVAIVYETTLRPLLSLLNARRCC